MRNHRAGAAHSVFRAEQDRNLIELIMSRRSVAPKRLVAPGPTSRELEMIVATAATAPDHCGLRPWRLICIPDEARAALADVFAVAKRECEPHADDLEIERARRRALNAPTLLGAIFCPVTGHSRVPQSEQLVALGAALQNILLASHAFGYAAMITSGHKMKTRALQDAFCRNKTEMPAAFVSIGTSENESRPRADVSARELMSVWPQS